MKKLKILFYGFRHGHINSLYKRVRSSDIAEIAGCIEPNDKARAKAEKSLGAVFSERSYDEWLRTDIDAVAIGNAYGERGRAIIKALSAGKHVIADKPICTSLEELYEIRRLAIENRLCVACMLDLRYIPQAEQAKRLLGEDYLGNVHNISFNGQHCLSYGSRPEWYFEEGMHGGTINDIAIHGIDLIRVLTGMEFVRIDAARTWNAYAYKHKHFKDCATFMARLSNGASVLADVSYSSPPGVAQLPTYWEFRFWCDNGMLEFSYHSNTVTVYREGTHDPIVIECEKADHDYLDELYDDIQSGSLDGTMSVLRSTEAALTIQQTADMEV